MSRYKEVIEKLRSYRDAKNECERIKLRLEEVETDLYGLSGTDYSKVNVRGGGYSAAIETVIARKNELEEKLARALENKYTVETEVREYISVLSNKDHDQDILLDKYIELLPLKVIKNKYYYSYEYLKNKYTNCYKKLEMYRLYKKVV